jgi:hypothetical protein
MADVTEQLQKMQKQIESLAAEVRFLKSFGNVPDTRMVGADYVAQVFDISEEAVVRGRYDTDKLRRARTKPVGFIKSEVDALHRELHVKTKTERALEAERRANTRKNRK